MVDNPDLGSGGASRGGSSPPTRTKPCPASMAGRFRTRAGGLRRFTVTPPLNPLPRGGDSAAEAAVRLQAKSLRSEVPSIQGLGSARADYLSECSYRSIVWTHTSIFGHFCLHRSTIGTYTSTLILFGLFEKSFSVRIPEQNPGNHARLSGFVLCRKTGINTF